MNCCSTDGANKFFSKNAKRYAKKFQKKGLDKASSLIVSSLTRLDVSGKSVLDIGCGAGGVHFALLKNGAASAFGVEIADGMLVKAKEIAASIGFAERVRYHLGDFAQTNGSIPASDIVVLDKVVCCSAEPEAIINKSTEKCRAFYAVSYPRDSLLARVVFKWSEFLGRTLRWSFHPFYHEPEMLDAVIVGSGLREVSSATTIIWQIKVFERTK
jgi:magnesium-protoporphyrin O-methyltransferase